MSLTIIERNVQLDLYDHDLTPSKIKAIALDSKTRYVGAEIHNGGQTYDVGQNTAVTLTIIRPDKTGVQITGEPFQYTVGEGETVYGAYAELTQTALAISGTLKAQFMLTSGDQILRTEIFSINNGVALDAETSEWAGEYQGYNLDELVQSVNTAVATVEGMEQDVSELKSGFNDSLYVYNDVVLVRKSANFTVNSGTTTSHELWRSLHLAVGKYIIQCEQGTTLESVTRNTFGYKKVGASGFTYESSAANYHLAGGNRSWSINIAEEADYQFILWVNNPSADVTYSGIMFKSAQTKQDADIDVLRTLVADNTVEINALNDALYDRSTDFTVNSGATTSHELWRSLHLAVGKYTLTCKQGSTLSSVTRNTFGYKKEGATGFIYESNASDYNLSSGKRSWTFAVTEEANYQIILWVNNPSATVTYSEISICGESAVEKTVGVIVDKMPLYTVPPYFENNIVTAITTIKSNMDAVGRHGDTFVFITDLHWGRTYSNTENSPSLIQRLTEELPISLVVCGGDLIDSGSKELMVGFMTDCMKAFTSFLHGKFLVVRGNHDSNQDGISDPTQWIGADEFYRIALKDADYSITEYANDGYFDYYIDNPSTKTRYVIIDTGYAENMDSEQIVWVQSVLDKDDGYKVLFFIHAVCENINDAVVWRGYTNTLFPILDAHKSKVCGIFSGHTHTDESLSTPGGIPVIITDTDSLRVAASSPTGTANTATAGTDTEQCFDVVTIDYSARTIKCIRVGRGADRTITY